MTKEQIINILREKIELSLSHNYKSVYIDGIDGAADAILGLQNKEIELKEQDNYPNMEDNGWMTDKNHLPD